MLPRGDRSFAKKTGLPQPLPYAVETVRIPASDGITLGADLYTPNGMSKGLLLTRGPYGRSAMMAQMAASVWAAQGYTVLFASSRGTADSEGDFDPMRTEAADGDDIVDWMRGQAWYPGRFATVGGSYLGHTQWATLSNPPADLVAAVVLMGPHDFARHGWGSGSFNLDFIGWSEQVRLQSGRSMLKAIIGMITSERRLRPVLNSTPLADAATAYFGDNTPWMRDRLERDDLADPYWEPMQHAAALEKAEIPILILGGWQDIFLRQSIEQFRRLHERGVETALTIGPWTHVELRANAAKTTNAETIAWLDTHLAGIAAPRRSARVRLYDKGIGTWREFDDLPSTTTSLRLALTGDGGLTDADTTSSATLGECSFVYDPADPTPTVGGPVIAHGGYVNDSSLASRMDTLAYTGPALPAAVTVLGAPQVTLAHRTEHPDSDLFVRLSDVDARGRSRNVTEGFVRLKPGAEGLVTVELLTTAYTFKPGHRIRLVIAGGSFPQYARSAGTGENPLLAPVLRSNTHTIEHGASSLRLPVAGV